MTRQTVTTDDIRDKAVTLADMADLPTLTLIGNDTGGAATPKALTVAEVNAMGVGGTSIPLLTADPVAPDDGDLWLLRETIGAITVPDGEPIGLLLALTYTSSAGTVQPLKLSVNDGGTLRRLQFA